MRQIVRRRLKEFKISPEEFLEIRNMTITTKHIGEAPPVPVSSRKKTAHTHTDVGDSPSTRDTISEMRMASADFMADYRAGLERMKLKSKAEAAKTPPLKPQADPASILLHSNAQKQGWLLKRPVNRDAKLAFGTSKRRYFYLSRRALIYFKTSQM